MTDEEIAALRHLTASESWQVETVGVPAHMCVSLTKATLLQLLDEIERAKAESAAARQQVRLITQQYKPGWVQGLDAVARQAGYDPDTARHEGVEPPDFIQDVIDGLRADNTRLRDALGDIREFAAQEHVMRFDDGDIALADFCTSALEVPTHQGKANETFDLPDSRGI